MKKLIFFLFHYEMIFINDLLSYATKNVVTVLYIYGLTFMPESLLLRNFVPVIVFMAHFIMFDNARLFFKNCIEWKFKWREEIVVWSAFITRNAQYRVGLENKGFAVSNDIYVI